MLLTVVQLNYIQDLKVHLFIEHLMVVLSSLLIVFPRTSKQSDRPNVTSVISLVKVFHSLLVLFLLLLLKTSMRLHPSGTTVTVVCAVAHNITRDTQIDVRGCKTTYTMERLQCFQCH